MGGEEGKGLVGHAKNTAEIQETCKSAYQYFLKCLLGFIFLYINYNI